MNDLSFASNWPLRRVSALLSIDGGATDVAESLESLFGQSMPPDQLVLLLDTNSLSPDQEAIVARYVGDSRIRRVDTIEVSAKRDFAVAMNAGLKVCIGEWIMYAYANGVSHPDRLAIQLDYAARYPDIDLFATWCEEFDAKGRQVIKASAIHHSAVVDSLRWRNVLVDSSVLVRSRTLQGIGGYSPRFPRLESYDLFVRLALANARFRVIPAELVRVHVQHRADLLHLWTNTRFRVACWRAGFVTARQFLIVSFAHFVFDFVSAFTRGSLYPMVRAKETTRAEVRWLATRYKAESSLATADETSTL